MAERIEKADSSSVQEIPTRSSTASSYHTAVEEPPSCFKGCCLYVRSLICSPFQATEVSTLSLVHLICTLAIGVSLSISVDIEDVKSVRKPSLYYFLVTYMIISILWLFGTICCGEKTGCCLAKRQFHSHNVSGYLIIGVTFLCIGSSFNTAVEFLPFAFSRDCTFSNDTTRHNLISEELTSEFIFAFTKFIFLILQLYFFCRFSSKTFMESSIIRLLLMHIIAVNLCIWFYIIADESVPHTSKVSNTSCLPYQDIVSFRDTVNGFLYPFSIEYSVMSSVLFFLIWFRLKRRDQQERPEDSENPPSSQPPAQENTCCQKIKYFFLDKCFREGIPQGEKKPASFWRSAICGYVLGVGILVYILLIVTVLAIEFDHDQAIAVYFYHGSSIAISFLMSLVCLFGLKYLNYHPKEDQTPHTIVDTALIMIGVSGCYLLTGFKVVSDSNEYSCDHKPDDMHPATNLTCMFLRVKIVDNSSSLIQFTLQAFFIVRALRRSSLVALPSTGKISSALIVRRCSAFLSVANIGMWVMSTFELRDIGQVEVPETQAFTKSTWLILSHVASPLCIFFQLHSVFCCFEIVINRFAVHLPEATPYKPVPTDEEP